MVKEARTSRLRRQTGGDITRSVGAIIFEQEQSGRIAADHVSAPADRFYGDSMQMVCRNISTVDRHADARQINSAADDEHVRMTPFAPLEELFAATWNCFSRRSRCSAIRAAARRNSRRPAGEGSEGRRRRHIDDLRRR